MSAILSIRKSDYEALVSVVTELRNAALTVHAEREKLRAERDDLIRENESLHDVHDLLLAARAKVAVLEQALRGMMDGSVYRTPDGIGWWHRIAVPKASALDAALAALKEGK